MDGQKWEDLPLDLLVNVFGRAGMESLILDVPFVCKSWYKATLSPLCWQILVFPKMSPDPWCEEPFTLRSMDEFHIEGYFPVTAFIKFVVSRSKGSATVVALPGCCTEEALAYVADECPALKTLVLPYDLRHDNKLKLPNLISKWKNLEFLRFRSNLLMQEILSQISINCKHFSGLGVTSACIDEDETLAIVNLLPNLKYLNLRKARIEREDLLSILKGCKELFHLDIRDCIGFEGDDDEILKLASHITTFMCEGSSLYDYEDDYFDRPNYRDDGFHDGNISD